MNAANRTPEQKVAKMRDALSCLAREFENEGRPNVADNISAARDGLPAASLITLHDILTGLFTTPPPATMRDTLERNNGWLDMKDAPRDGTPVDLWIVPFNGQCRRVPEVWWVDGTAGDEGITQFPRWRNGDLTTQIRDNPDTYPLVAFWRPAPPKPRDFE